MSATVRPRRSGSTASWNRLSRCRPARSLAQLTSDGPHLINRYVSLLAYAKTAFPDQFRRFRDDLTDDTRAQLDHLTLPFEQETSAAAGLARAAPLILLISSALVAAALITVLLMGTIRIGPTGPIPVPTPIITQPTGPPA